MSGDGRAESDRVFGIQKRKAAIAAVLALLLSLGAIAAIGQITSYGKLLEAWHRASKAWLPLCLLGEIVSYTGYVVAYRSVAKADGGPVLRLRDAARVVAVGLGAYVVGSEAGGLGVDYWAMREAGETPHQAARRTLALNTLQVGGLAVLALLGGVVVLVRGAHGHGVLVMALVWISVVPAAIAGAVAVSGRTLAPRLLEAPDEGRKRPPLRHPGSFLRWLWTKARTLFADAIGGVVFVRVVVGHPRRYLGGLAGYPLFWIGDFFILWVALEAFGYTLSPARLAVAEATAWALTFVPLPGGGSGFAEAAMTYTLHAVGVPVHQALLAAIAYRGVNFWLPVLPALALLPSLRNLERGLEASGHAPEEEDAEVHATARR